MRALDATCLYIENPEPHRSETRLFLLPCWGELDERGVLASIVRGLREGKVPVIVRGLA